MRSAIVAVVAGLVLLSGCGDEAPGAGTVQVADDGWTGSHLAEPWQPSGSPLESTEGGQVALDEARDGVRLVFFGYTKCPDVCQVVMATIASAVNNLDDAEREQVEVVFVTTDPARDDAAVLRDYLDRFDPEFVGLTGPLPRIIEVAETLKVHVAQGQRLPSGGYEVDHSAVVVGIQDGGARIVWTQGVTPPELAADVRRLLEEDA